MRGSTGDAGMPGPTGMTHFELKSGWEYRHSELQGLCLKICNFIEKNPDIVKKVVITKEKIQGFI